MKLHEMTPHDLKEIALSVPNELTHARDFCVANRIILAGLGREYWAREVASSGAGGRTLFKGTHQLSVMRVADVLWRLRSVPNFEFYLAECLTKDLRSTFFELLGADMLRSACDGIEFVLPSRKRGADYDLRAFGLWGIKVSAVEIKQRTEPFNDPKRLRSFLNDHRTQLPPEPGGVFMFTLCLEGEHLSQDEIADVVTRWIRGTRRVARVVLQWDPLEGNPNASAHHLLVYDAQGVDSQASDALQARGPTEIEFLEHAGLKSPVELTVPR